MSPIFRFADFELDANLFELRRAGEVVEAQAKVLDLVLYLVRHRDRLVTKRELLDEVWRGVFVSGTWVSHAIMEARRMLDDSAVEPQKIVTVRGRGYRFIADVEELTAAAPAPAPAPAAPPPAVHGYPVVAVRHATLRRCASVRRPWRTPFRTKGLI